MLQIYFLLLLHDFEPLLQLLLFTFELSDFAGLISLRLGLLFFFFSEVVFGCVDIVSSIRDSVPL